MPIELTFYQRHLAPTKFCRRATSCLTRCCRWILLVDDDLARTRTHLGSQTKEGIFVQTLEYRRRKGADDAYPCCLTFHHELNVLHVRGFTLFIVLEICSVVWIFVHVFNMINFHYCNLLRVHFHVCEGRCRDYIFIKYLYLGSRSCLSELEYILEIMLLL